MNFITRFRACGRRTKVAAITALATALFACSGNFMWSGWPPGIDVKFLWREPTSQPIVTADPLAPLLNATFPEKGEAVTTQP